MELPWLSLITLLTLSLLLSFSSSTVKAFKRCPNCGSTQVPYPLSTGLDCGDPDYKIRCDERGSLWFDTLNGSTNPIKTIDPSGQRFVLRPPGFEPNKCVSVDIKYHGIQLDPNLPFNVSSSNTVIIMNCTKDGLDSYSSQGFNCSDNSLCHKFLNQNLEVRSKCRGVSSCCWYKTGASVNTYKVYRARTDMCSAYQSYMNLDLLMPVSKWGEPAVEILWETPREPVCKIQGDCKDLVNSVCLGDSTNLGQTRCFCKKGFRWNSVNAVCEVNRCSKGKKCKRWSNLPLIGGLTGGVGAILIAGFVMKTIITKQNRITAGSQSWASLRKLHRHLLATNSTGLDRIFTGKEIVKSTNNFAKSNLLGFGGFGEVFKGNLDDGTTVAVKRAKLGNEKSIYQIVNEVQILCQVSHKNLVKLLGCCIELDMPILVYEFVPNGTLYEHIYCGGGGGGGVYDPLPWRRRLMIAHQTAQGLAYLHSSATPPIYHRDVKSSNILLDENLDVKVADFGLSRLGLSDVSHVTTCAQGTLGYLDPEYYLNFQLTDKSDVYSFGVVLFELLTCKKAIDFNRDEEDVNLVVFVRKVLKEGRLMDVIDPVIGKGATGMKIESMKELGVLAERCVKETRQCRPSMNVVVKEIESILHGI
ncbi:PREDICTED: wall-associated receptor kinase-like 15 [Camelina sativa]|uniref:Wall-associated receptor kinase-like 15 n=1 Tax=Camelina sativa TaxID=90675 RepID=A0ABM0YPV4_CAMSA|nr:PREDICTED: wall-associated receptor kinase-like 15 [Camelina sativa]